MSEVAPADGVGLKPGRHQPENGHQGWGNVLRRFHLLSKPARAGHPSWNPLRQVPNGTGVVLPEPVDGPSDVVTTDRAYVPTMHLFRMLWWTMAEIEVPPEVQAVAVK